MKELLLYGLLGGGFSLPSDFAFVILDGAWVVLDNSYVILEI